ncbi:MAG: Hsp20/alpha crystallin family protein [Candidatus Altiarchaeota archaeon]|nr:Hsp20/alpha crystallin family protein [Candidatus Altiarchaeota archaeon]
MDTEIIIFPVLAIVLILVVLFINQRYRYQNLRDNLENNLRELQNQESSIKKLENEMREYIMSGKGIRDWGILKQQVNELSDLPSFAETEDEYVLKTHLSRIKKNHVQVSGIARGIKITVESTESPPLHVLYSTPSDIDPHGLKVIYKGTTLKIRAPKLVVKNKKSKKE